MNNPSLLLGQAALGRILLHLACAMRQPSHWNFHWHGIQREFPLHLCPIAPLPPYLNALSTIHK